MKKGLLITSLMSATLVLGACGNEEEPTKEPKQEQKGGDVHANKEMSEFADKEYAKEQEQQSAADELNDWANEDPDNLDKVPEGELSNNFRLDVEIYLENMTSYYEELTNFESVENMDEVSVIIEDARYQHEIAKSNSDDMPTRNAREEAVHSDLVEITNLTGSALDKIEEGAATDNESMMMMGVEDIEKANELIANLDVE